LTSGATPVSARRFSAIFIAMGTFYMVKIVSMKDDAAYITGQTISVSGGLTMHG
jgi:hypothetical protein